MSRALLLSAYAENDLAEARDWYDTRRNGLGDEFLAAVNDVFSRIRSHPLLYPEAYGPLRRAVMRRFPYLVYFITGADAITIVGCLHVRRRQTLVTSRL